MTGIETAARSAITTLLQRVRTEAPEMWVAEAVERITAAAGDAALVPDGMVTADGPEAAAALAGLQERAEEMKALATEMAGGFKRGGNGYSQRVSVATYEGWQVRLRRSLEE
jgi:hypothetical protein